MRNAITSLLANLLILILNFATGILVARLLGPEQRGLLAAAVSICTLVAGTTSWSIADILARSLSRADKPKFDLFGPYTVLILAGTLIGMSFISILVWSDKLFLPGSGSLVFGGLILIIPFMHVSQTAMGVLQGTQAWTAWNITRISPHLFYFLMLILLIGRSTDARSVAIIFALASLAPVVLSIFFAATKEISFHGTSLREVRDTAHDALRIHGGRVFQMTRQNLDRILIPLVFGATTLGHYVVAMTLAVPLYAAATTLTSIYIPRITSELEAGSSQRLRRTLGELLGLILLGVCFALLYAWMSPHLVELLFGPDFSESAGYLPLTVLIVACYCVTKLLEAYMIALGRTTFILIAETLPVLSMLLGLVLFQTDFFTFLVFLGGTALVSIAIYAGYFTISLRRTL